MMINLNLTWTRHISDNKSHGYGTTYGLKDVGKLKYNLQL
jgi:hypothetical protein